MYADSPPPPKSPPSLVQPLKLPAKNAITYDELVARVYRGETLTVAVGIPAGAGVVSCEIPGEKPGLWECFPVYTKVCHGLYCTETVTPTMRPAVAPKAMPAKR